MRQHICTFLTSILLFCSVTSVACRMAHSSDVLTNEPTLQFATFAVTTSVILTPSVTNSVLVSNPPTHAPMPSPTVTLLPGIEPTLTLPQPQNSNQDISLAELLSSNYGCELPCWWGVVPGESTIESIKMFFDRPLFDWISPTTVVAMDSNTETSVVLEFQLDGSLIKMVHVGGRGEGNGYLQEWQNYSLPTILSRYEVPSNVYIYYPWRPDPFTPPLYHLFLFYEDLGIEIDYAGLSSEINSDGTSTACPDLAQVIEINLLLYQPGFDGNVLMLAIPPETVSFIEESDTVYDMINWTTATGTSLETFHEMFSSQENESCFDFLVYR